MTEVGDRYNKGKLPYDLVPPIVEEALAQILLFGANKYSARNWEKGMPYSVSYSSLMRHLRAWWQGEELDPESRKPHTWHVLWNIMAIVEMERRLKDGDLRLSVLDIDDRPYIKKNQETENNKDELEDFANDYDNTSLAYLYDSIRDMVKEVSKNKDYWPASPEVGDRPSDTEGPCSCGDCKCRS
jgi:dATP/dGTP diphosphohydrolase, N-terminal